MKTKESIIDFALPNTSKPRWPRYASIALSGVLVAGSLMVAGAKIQARLYPVPLPANESCIKAKDAVKENVAVFSSQIVAALDGQDAPAPDMAKIKDAVKQCEAKAGSYQVEVSK